MSMMKAMGIFYGIILGGCAALILAMPWIVVGFDRYSHWVSTFR